MELYNCQDLIDLRFLSIYHPSVSKWLNDNTVEKIKFTALALEWTKQGNFGNMLIGNPSVVQWDVNMMTVQLGLQWEIWIFLIWVIVPNLHIHDVSTILTMDLWMRTIAAFSKPEHLVMQCIIIYLHFTSSQKLLA